MKYKEDMKTSQNIKDDDYSFWIPCTEQKGKRSFCDETWKFGEF